MQGAQILVVEDDPDVAAGMHDFLAARGFVTDAAADGPAALALASTHDYDAIVLDLLLPGFGGLEFCRRLRADLNRSVPVLMLTALDRLDDKLGGFDAGADDYMVKPFEPEELAARLRALIMRSRGGPRRELVVGGLRFDTGSHLVTREGVALALNLRCRRLLEELMRASPDVVSRVRLERALWGDDPPDTDSLRTHVYLLRKAVDHPFDTPMIETVHGHGYRIVEPD